MNKQKKQVSLLQVFAALLINLPPASVALLLLIWLPLSSLAQQPAGHKTIDLHEVSISSGVHKKYRNKGNPAVELIQQIINHKPMNRMESSDFLQYDQYERIGLSVYDIPQLLLKRRFMSKFLFMLDTASTINGQKKSALPVYFDEKLSKQYFRKSPQKSIQVLQAEKAMNILKFIDTAGLDIYLNRLYGNKIDIYQNNIFIVTNQFLSPIADHAPDFYKFFLADTVKYGNERLLQVDFTPRAKGDLLFEGKLLVSMDGRYAVKSCVLNVNAQININFMRSLEVDLDFQQHEGGRYYLNKSKVKADFGLLKEKGMALYGERTVSYTNYKLDSAQSDVFYRGKSLQSVAATTPQDSSYWATHRMDTLGVHQQLAYQHMTRLERMKSFKVLTWLASTFTGGYADLGPVQLGEIGSLFSFNSQEGARFQVGGRTTPKLSPNIYFEGYTGYGTRDKQLKYDVSTYFALNKTPFYRFPNDYFRLRYLYDVNLPGQNYPVSNAVNALSSFQTGKTDYWIYNRIFSLAYVKDFESHLSYNLAFKNWRQQAAAALQYRYNDAAGALVNTLSTTEIDFGLRYAPHEQLIQGTMYRRTIHSKYPIYNLQVNHAFKGLLNGAYSYTNISANIYKRFYFSQLGYADVTLLGSFIKGKVPFPLLNISPANQSIAYDADAYNKMNYLEFVSDHYAGLNFTQSFDGFFLNKIPLIKHLKWREYLSLKVLYGGLRDENNPQLSSGLYRFPTGSNGGTPTNSLGSTPYVETGAGIGNIFKVLRIDVIHRYNYLNHLGVSPYGIKVSFNPDF